MEQKNLDPEKIKLLKEKHKEKNKKCSESRSKIAQELYDSSSTDRFQLPKRKSKSAQNVKDSERYYDGRRNVFQTFEGQTKDGWYTNQQQLPQKSPSRVSCALKKLLGSEYACVGCLAFVFLVSIVVGLLLVFKTMPSSAADVITDDRNLMRVQRVKGKRQLSDDYDMYRGRKYSDKSSDDGYHFDTFSGATEKKEFGYNEHTDQLYNDDIGNILSANAITDSENEKLRDFYRKLVETDAEIKRLKQNLQNNNIKIRNDKQELDRIKRSSNKTKALRQNSHQKNKQFYKSNSSRNKRQNNATNNDYGMIIKEKEIIVYKPKNSRKIVQYDTNFHKKHFKQPFCKHKQNVDDSLVKNKLNIKVKNSCASNTNTDSKNTSTFEYDNYKMNAKIQNYEINELVKSNENEDIKNIISVKDLDMLSNVTINNENNILRSTENVIRHKRLLLDSTQNHKAKNVKNDNIPRTLLRNGRSLKSFDDENHAIANNTKARDVNENNYMSDTDFNDDYKYRSRKIFQYDENDAGVSDLVTTSTLDALNNYTNSQEASITGDLDNNALPVISTVKYSKYHDQNNSVSSYDAYLTTKPFINKTNVKREAASKFVFWDEFHGSNKSKIKYSKESKIQKSRNWIKSRLSKHNMEEREDFRTINEEESYRSMPKIRKIRKVEYGNDKNMDDVFKKLNAKMERIFQEAAYAIQNSRKIKVRESKADMAASTLMQRLVRMMRDLVDIQDQEKTCVELPQDLRKFLEWLVPPTEENAEVDNLNPDIADYIAVERKYGAGIDESNDVAELPSSLADDTEAEVDKLQCMETIRAVKSLVNQYEGLSSEDKNKLSGVKDYLHRQLQYLNKLAGDDDAENYNIYQESEDRFKRESNKIKHKRKFWKRMRNNRFKDFFQRFKMKHTKATTQAMDTSFASNFTVKDADKENISFTGQIQKNINDIYNRAFEEAKKITTEDVNITIT